MFDKVSFLKEESFLGKYIFKGNYFKLNELL